jgi:hypothetical protein
MANEYGKLSDDIEAALDELELSPSQQIATLLAALDEADEEDDE